MWGGGGLSVQATWAWSAEARPSLKQGFQAPGRGGGLLPGAQGGPFALLSLCAEFSRHPGSVSCQGGDASRWTGVVLF